MPTFIEILDSDNDDFSSNIGIPDILDYESFNRIMPSSTAAASSSSSLSYQNDSNVTNDTIITASLSSTEEKSRESLMSEIEDTIEQIFTSISIGEPFKLPMKSRPLTGPRIQK
jgi:hypothetical protein